MRCARSGIQAARYAAGRGADNRSAVSFPVEFFVESREQYRSAVPGTEKKNYSHCNAFLFERKRALCGYHGERFGFPGAASQAGSNVGPQKQSGTGMSCLVSRGCWTQASRSTAIITVVSRYTVKAFQHALSGQAASSRSPQRIWLARVHIGQGRAPRTGADR